MHMADSLVSPAVGGTMWAVSGGLVAYCGSKAAKSDRDNLVPLMGVLGAFIFTTQMINFAIPGTGSSGHLGGGLILSALLGPHAAFLVMASVLTVQAFFFGDGGLLALGCNIFNLGFFPAFVAYPLIYRPMAGDRHGSLRGWSAAVAAAAIGLLLGALCVVVETSASGISDLPFRTFLLLMLPIHLAIGVAEGLATAAVVSFVARARPEALATAPGKGGKMSPRHVLATLCIAAVVLGGAASWFASTHPDGLEWAIARVTGKEDVTGPKTGVHKSLAGIQDRTAFLPDYGFRPSESGKAGEEIADTSTPAWPAVNAGTSLAGVVGGVMTLVLACLIGVVLRCRHGVHGMSGNRAGQR